ncbi:putative 1-phosphatidylinositol-3-phosphate 5-kinase FAB1D [Lycium ferocissimum]|uniref:putative 1-phosphatidylinositol-3-phosphate 5-kinase FAB1D n=1 Tax=Lycium ferocissimum TaxID=112874 RepID=UPI0028168942|nr:putative 1-phosphatidylinositol-3-phosphate 5-kinase FAB1D [Lycium ferocissimum]
MENFENYNSDENDAYFWLPPESEDYYDDDTEFDNDDDLNLGKPTSLFNTENGGSRSDKFKEEKQKLLKDMMDQKLKPLVNDLLNSFGVVSDNWVDIVISLSFEATSFLKPNATQGKAAMDPNRYLKVKCIATGSRTQSQFIRGLVFNKHATHKHMPTKYNKPRLMLIQGELGVSSNELSELYSMHQEYRRVEYSIINKIGMYEPDVILVEKYVSRDIQEYALRYGWTLVLDIKLHRLERIAQCTGSSIISPEILEYEKLKQCDSFYFEKFLEEHASSGDSGKAPSKTLMFIKGCSTRLGCTILLMGSNSNELKKVKYVVRRAVTTAYNLILETCFLLDQKAMLSSSPPNQVVNLIITDGELSVSVGQQILPTNEEPIAETSSSLEEEGKSLSFKPNNPEDHGLTDVQVSIDLEQRATLSDKEKTPEKEQIHCPLLSAEESLDVREDEGHNMDVMISSLHWESISVMMSSCNAKRGTKCEHIALSRIKFYQDTDIPLGKFLQDNLLNQNHQCWTCGESPEGHIFRYAHQGKLLTIQVRSLPLHKVLPGERERKLWMWSRNGRSENTKRVLMSSGSRGLSFGKFLQLTFSNPSLFSTLPDSRDFLYFFGLGSVVAMFKYSTLTIYSVSLPPVKLEFSGSIKGKFKDVVDVYMKAIRMFLDVEKALKAIQSGSNRTTVNLQGSTLAFSEVEKMLKEERSQFEIEIENTAKEDAVYKALSLNRIRLELLLVHCVWDRRLHSLMSSDCRVTYPETIDQKHRERDSLSAIIENDKGWWTPFPEIRHEYMKNLQRGHLTRLGAETVACKLTTDEDGKLHIPLGKNDKYIVSHYEDEFSSIIACAALLKYLPVVSQHHEVDHSRNFSGEHKYSVICPYAAQFLHLRDRCCLSELDYISSLSRCRSSDPNAKTLDDRFIVKEIRRNEYESFLKFAPCYFDYMDQCIEKRNPTCLAKILGVHQVMVTPRCGKETRHDFVVMENPFFGKNITRQYELKGILHGQINSSDNGFLREQNFVNDMNIYPIYVSNSSKKKLQKAVWNDTTFLNSINAMDYSLFVGMDTQGNELVCGIIDYLTQYTWNKQLLNWFKVISPKEYKKRFRKFINTYVPTILDQV